MRRSTKAVKKINMGICTDLSASQMPTQRLLLFVFGRCGCRPSISYRDIPAIFVFFFYFFSASPDILRRYCFGHGATASRCVHIRRTMPILCHVSVFICVCTPKRKELGSLFRCVLFLVFHFYSCL